MKNQSFQATDYNYNSIVEMQGHLIKHEEIKASAPKFLYVELYKTKKGQHYVATPSNRDGCKGIAVPISEKEAKKIVELEGLAAHEYAVRITS